MRIAVPKEVHPHETRVALSPDIVGRYRKLGIEVTFQTGLAEHLGWPDSDFEQAGARLVVERPTLLADADLVLRVRPPEREELDALATGTTHISYLDPFNQRDLVEAFASKKLRAVSMEMVPRSTLAQKMDALSSQHSLAGYYMVLLAAERLGKALPMMMTPAGTIQPARVFVIGAGVAGLQAIATAKRLGARVEAFDTRPVVKEQVESLGAKFLDIDLGQTGQTAQGYATELTEEQKAKQQEGMAKACATADVVITTAQLFGRPAPQVVSETILQQMRPGAIVVDYAVESGGNVAGSVPGEEVVLHGVRVIGLRNYPGRVAADASRMYASNLYNMITHFHDTETGGLDWTRDSDISDSCVITAAGEVINATIRKHYGLPELEPAAQPEPPSGTPASADPATDDGPAAATSSASDDQTATSGDTDQAAASSATDQTTDDAQKGSP